MLCYFIRFYFKWFQKVKSDLSFYKFLFKYVFSQCWYSGFCFLETVILVKDSKINSLGQSVGLDNEDLSNISSSNGKNVFRRVNPLYFIGQLFIAGISWIYVNHIEVVKQNAAYPHQSTVAAYFLSPLPLSAHLGNLIYSLRGGERSGLQRKPRLLVFFSNFLLFLFLFYFIYFSVPKFYHANVMYSVFSSDEFNN